MYKKELETLIEKVKQWSIDRGLNTVDPFKQLIKLREEYGELNSGIAKDNEELIKDSIGDTMVVLIILGQITGNDVYIDEMIQFVDVPTELYKFSLEKTLAQFDISIGNFSGNLLTNLPTNVALFNAIVILSHIASKLDTSLKDCLQLAYDEIKDRKGRMIDGVWVKEEDLKGDTL